MQCEKDQNVNVQLPWYCAWGYMGWDTSDLKKWEADGAPTGVIRGDTALHIACRYGETHRKAVEWLLAHGADTDMICNRRNETSRQAATKFGM